MKTRSHIIMAFLLLICFTIVPNSFGQFKKYKSKTSFKPKQIKPSVMPTLEEMDEMDETQLKEIADSFDPDDENISQLADDAKAVRAANRKKSISKFGSSVSANEKTFGKRNSSSALISTKRDSKFVNLNPETAFGPEVIESFDFPDSDIMELTLHMQKLTGINLILDKEIKGKVSITAPTPITVGDAWRAYLTALNMAGYTLVKTGAFFKIIQSRDVRYTATKIYTGGYTPDTENHIMKIVALKNVDASEIARNFRPFMSRYGRIIDLKQTNTIIISDSGSNISRLEKLIKFLDVPGHEETLQIIPVKHSSAQEIAKLLDSILKGGRSSRSSRRSSSSSRSKSKRGGSQNISRIIAEPRTNSIIAMANAEGARQLRKLIKKLDVKLISSSTGRIHVYYLNWGNAEDLAKTLSSLISGSTKRKKGKSSSRFSSSSSLSDNAIFQSEVKITADKNNNAMVVVASPTDWLTLKNVIAKLDIPRDQVYVEGLIMESNISRVKGFGVEYVGAYGAGAAQRAGFTQGGDLFNLIGGNPTSISGFFIGGGAGGTRTININGTDIKVNSVNGLIKAIATHQNTNILATPQILCMDNTEAEFEVGDTVPVSEQITNSNGTTSNNFKLQEAKLSLKITPQINKVTRFVKLKINQRIDDFKGTPSTAGGGSATTTRSAITEVMIRDRDTIAMGGLLRDKVIDKFSKIPLLGDIPVLGWLFKNKETTIEKVNLLFFLTPHILSPYDETASKHSMDALTKRNKNLQKLLGPDEEDFHKEEVTKLTKKIRRQMEGPLYNKSLPQSYKSNNEGSGIEMMEIPDEQVPNYQEIIEAAEKK